MGGGVGNVLLPTGLVRHRFLTPEPQAASMSPPAGNRGQLVFGQVCQLEMSPTPGAVVWLTPFCFVFLEWEAQDSFGTTWFCEVSNLCPSAQACFTDPRGPRDPQLLPLSF